MSLPSHGFFNLLLCSFVGLSLRLNNRLSWMKNPVKISGLENILEFRLWVLWRKADGFEKRIRFLKKSGASNNTHHNLRQNTYQRIQWNENYNYIVEVLTSTRLWHVKIVWSTDRGVVHPTANSVRLCLNTHRTNKRNENDHFDALN